MTTFEKIRAEIDNECKKYDRVGAICCGLNVAIAIIDKYAEQEPISVSVSEKEPDEISEEVTLRFFRNSLKVRWQDMVIYNVEWLKKNWQMEMDIVCGVKPCDDAVSRQAVLEIAKQHTLTNDYLAIQNLPSVNPQPKTGHWINDEVGCYYCSECCGYVASHDDAYCRYCGAKMVEPRESEDRE